MHWQTLISIPIWMAVLWATRVVSDDLSELQKTELANKLNTLVQHPGWRLMGDVRVVLNQNTRASADPMPEILEAVSSNRKPVDQSNVLLRYKDIWTVLMCKYAEITFRYRILVQHFIRICRSEKTWHTLNHSFFDCFHTLLTKLHDVSPRFLCMADALDLIYSLRPQSKPEHSVMTAFRKLAEFSSTIGPTITSSTFHQNDTTVDAVELQMKSICDYFAKTFIGNLYYYTNRYCDLPSYRELTETVYKEHYLSQSNNRLIPQETETMLQYVQKEIDDSVDDILGKWFYDLGFAYDSTGNVTISEINSNVIATETPNYGVVIPT